MSNVAEEKAVGNGQIKPSLALSDHISTFLPPEKIEIETMKFVPSYELYGELLSGRAIDAIHHEPIKERSSQHNWTIRVHRHERLAQIFVFHSPDVNVHIGDAEFISHEPMILIVPPNIPHGFRFSEDVRGDVLSLHLSHLPGPEQALFRQFSSEADMLLTRTDSQNFSEIATLVAQLARSYHRMDPNREEILTAQLSLIISYLKGDLRGKNAIQPTKRRTVPSGPDKVEAFCKLVEASFQKDMNVDTYAKQLNLSAPHLTRLCRTSLGIPPNTLVQQRRLLEAKRLLTYTTLSMAEIAHKSGFRDPAFFSRTFKKKVGVAPNSYRKHGSPK